MSEATALNEQELIRQYAEAKRVLSYCKEELDKAQERADQAEYKLIQMLQEQGKEASARYEGIGWVSLVKPRCYASCTIENQPLLFKFLRGRKRGDMIKKTVAPSALSSFIGKLLEDGKKVPPFVSYYLKTSIKYNGGAK